jgi:hypothetical protein
VQETSDPGRYDGVIYWVFIQQQWIDILRQDAGEPVIGALRDYKEDHTIRAKIWEQELEIWPSRYEWCNYGTIPLTHEAVPKDWIVGPDGLEVLVYQAFTAHSRGFVVISYHRDNWHGARASNLENEGGLIFFD